MIKTLAALMLGLLLALAVPAQLSADEPVNSTFLADLAIHGYDPVAYFIQEEAVEGLGDYEFEWNGTTWRFASEQHRAMFMENPEKYAPAYGGYCAWAVAQGYTADVDPTAWKIVNGRLYLNYDHDIQQKWERNHVLPPV
ncbi:YHS domain-containing (seleno)protein [Desulfohalovibrio reitneri]|uniref:YHS domain-containing (seleno)protein n=1 Tax=Desulfohalovibrio reitneri TaxID=1307759 RepID=UPI0006895283|nr:YHS domain-containing (seleno)protein [Desulfohalovibrio reitneri]